ncbi:MAG: class I SAM-dependent methyltransferase [Lachnospiraceae bacterium]|nr:class I SAM-dependent methyltransferase [Lachnospiraceae bacterium]
MKPYSAFSDIYDRCMDNVPYDEWAEALVRILREADVADGSLVADLGCGTGEMTARLREAGFDMIGIDGSEEMLAIAQEKEYERVDELLADASPDDTEAEENAIAGMIRYLHQDLREIELYGTVAAMVSVCDTMNYLLTEDDLREVFKKANNYLDRDGLFVFDVKTEYYYREVLGDNVRAEDYEDDVLLWDNSYDRGTRINEYRLTMFKKDEATGLFARQDELHRQRAYDLAEITRILAEAGMTFVRAEDAYTGKPVTETTERILIIAKESYQANKYYE